MIGGWLVKVFVGIAAIGFLIVEIGSPLVARAQADDAAHEVANEASFRLRDQFTDQVLQDACETEAADHDVTVVECGYDGETQEVVVEVSKHARSFLLDRFDAMKDWYEVEATARAKRK